MVNKFLSRLMFVSVATFIASILNLTKLYSMWLRIQMNMTCRVRGIKITILMVTVGWQTQRLPILRSLKIILLIILRHLIRTCPLRSKQL
jgi:uncharacterized membrane protein (UPF0182 family)